MIQPELTPAVERAFEAAQRLARALAHLTLEPEHLLRGLLEEEEGRAWLLLHAAGVDLVQFRSRAAGWDAPALPCPDVPLPQSRLIRQALQTARRLATDFVGDSTLSSEFVLLALLLTDEELRRRLETLGLQFAELEARVMSAKGPPLQLEEPLHLVETTETIDVGRILDAAANRAREALRVVEDYCRFVLDDAFLCRELKQLRHDLSETLEEVPAGMLLPARESQRDVGTNLTTPQEQTRHSLLAVLQANMKRLQEALRSLEEYGKLHGPRLGLRLEQLRYRSYTLERALVLGSGARERLAQARLYVLVTGSQCAGPLESTIKEAAAGGANIFQLREKSLNDRQLLERASQVRRWTREAGALFIMNDRPDLARLSEADGVHVGQEELPVKEVRRIVGPDALIGVSTHTIEQVRQAILDGASYIGVGPTFPSGTKEFADFPGLDFVRQAVAETSLPAFAIGGISPQNVAAVVAAGGRRVAVSQAICAAENPRAAARELIRLLAK